MKSLLILVVLAGVAHANMAKPTSGGQHTGEPHGIDVAIAREELVIDMRPVEHDGRVLVSATYHLDNRGDAKSLDLVFASGEFSLRDFRVTLDGKPVETRMRRDVGPLPPSWRAPHSTPDPEGGELSFDTDVHGAAPTAGFQLVVPPGAHVLAVTYDARALTHHARRPVLMHQFAYVLAPARSWAGFGGLAVTIHVPPGWIAAVAPEMTRDADTMTGKYPNVPADAIGITIHAPTGAYPVVRILGIVTFVLAIFGGGWLVHRAAFRRERRRAQRQALPSPGFAALGLALVWSALVIVCGWFAIFGADMVLPFGEADHRGYGAGFAMIGVVLLGMILFVVGIVVGIKSGRSAHPS